MDGDGVKNQSTEVEEIEIQEWLSSLEYVLKHGSPEQAKKILGRLQIRAQEAGVTLPFTVNTPYMNTIHKKDQPTYPGNREIERRIKSIIRWNAMAMVVRGNRAEAGIGGHISTYASAATILEVGFNHFFRARTDNFCGDFVYFQGHASPGVYSRAFVEGRLTEENLVNFRRELAPGGGLSSYPHPWLMPNFWQFPSVSMGLAPITGIYQARFMRYLEDRGLKPKDDAKIWVFMGDGECDEPESLGAITVASREKLDNLIFVINCNLQRLDGPVRGNGKIIQELEALFRGAQWNVLKVIWGGDWDPILDADNEGLLAKRMGEVVDGQYQKYSVESGDYIRKNFFGVDPKIEKIVKHLSDEQIQSLKRGGHDPEKVYAAFKNATQFKGAPTVILAKTIKGYGLGESGEGKNITHQQKKLNEDELRQFRTRFNIPISDEDCSGAPFYKPSEDSDEMKYLHERRKALGGYMPSRHETSQPLKTPSEEVFAEFHKGSEGREASTTMAYVRILTKLLKDKDIGPLIVPIIPDEARTFGMEALFRQCGIYSHVGQLYEPVDKDSLLYYKEAEDGQILEEGINEAGAISSFIAAGTAYSTQGINTIPFYIYYSMFGPQRVGDLIWAAADSRCRGFLIGGTAGRTTLNGEGLQHQDGHSHVLLSSVPNILTYHPSYAYEIAVIIREGIYRMYEKQENIFYYVSVGNENYEMPPMPEGSKEGILKGMYKFKVSSKKDGIARAELFGSGAILNQVLTAQKMLEDDYNITSDVWSVTSYNELRREGLHVERHNMLNPNKKPQVPFVTQQLKGLGDTFIFASDNMKILPDGISKWVPGPMVALGTDGFGRSESREALRDFFEVDARHIVYATLGSLAKNGKISTDILEKAAKDLNINPDKLNPM
ncbi:MAG: pyruvate dehydrogenase (acetyl-transferring), homodimeric type, partial [Candidatus Omnitrophica bacterium]|nr:pyruvate dehydrogenase (acetyl-transferring), homodimeric type [Candidatus Omnitrophota bacterium]